jgi:hypothetical protein
MNRKSLSSMLRFGSSRKASSAAEGPLAEVFLAVDVFAAVLFLAADVFAAELFDADFAAVFDPDERAAVAA